MNPADTPTFDATDLAALVDTVQRFSTERVRPNVDAWEAAGEIPRGLYREAAELGLLGLGYPEHLGGTPAPWRARNALSQTLARHGTSGGLMASLFSHNIGLPPVLAHGTPELQAEVGKIYVDPLIKQYIVSLSNATRDHDAAYLGASPRGSSPNTAGVERGTSTKRSQ